MKKVILVLLCVSLCLGILGCSNDDDTKQDANATETTAKSAKPNTSEKVDQIIMKAKDEAGNLTNEKVDEAATYLSDHYPDLFTSNEVMEKVMYYGALLQYWEGDTQGYNDLGEDAVQAVKYVYRGVEKVDDESTQANLRQMEKDAQNIINNR